jgi:UTP:GlnB (protein PII) uridylyltransferase
MLAAARQPDGLSEESVLAIASHLDSPERARALFALSIASAQGFERWEYDRLRNLHDLVQQALAQPELTGLDARNLLGQRRMAAIRAAGDDPLVARRIEDAPRAYLLSVDPQSIARQMQTLTALGRNGVLVTQGTTTSGTWLDIAAHDQPGLLASVTSALVHLDLDVQQAVIATWEDGAALESFRVDGSTNLDVAAVQSAVERALGAPLGSAPIADAEVAFDNSVSPFHTVCEIRAPDKPGLLHALATAFTAAQVDVHAARIAVDHDHAADRFELTTRTSQKLGPDECRAVLQFVAGGVIVKRRRWRRPRVRPVAEHGSMARSTT